MKHLGDVTKIKGDEVDPVDVLTFGFPCQDVSVAGCRKGVRHEENGDEETTRSGLFHEAVRIIKEMRHGTNGRYPTFAIFENVPGLLSSSRGEDFRIVLEELIKIVEPDAIMPGVPKNGWPYADCYCGEGWSLGYRIFDAQYLRTAQRRRRIYALIDFRGQRAKEILFERESLRGYFEEGRTAWEEAPSHAERSVGAADCPLRDGGGERTISLNWQAAVGAGLCVEEELVNPLSCTRVPAIVEAVTDRLVLDDQGGSQISVREDGKCPTLRAEMHGNIPCVMESAGFCPEQSAKTRGIGYEEEVAPTLRGGVVPAVVYDARGNGDGQTVNTITGDHENRITDYTSVVCEPFVKSHRATSADDATTWKHGEKSNTLNTFDLGETRYNELVVETVALEGNGQRPSHHGDGYIVSDKSYTLNTTEVHGVVYAMDRASFNQGQNAQYDFEITDSGVNSTLVAKGPSAVAYAIDQQGGKGGANYAENVMPTLCSDSHGTPHAVAYGIGNGQANQSFSEEVVGALNCMHDQQAVAVPAKPHYIVRRLTPTECARLQGFPDFWGHPDVKEELTEEDYRFWLDVRQTHDRINGRKHKDYTEQQILAWYNKLHTDSSEYKMWGNGIALPCAIYVMQGVEDAFK
jgi:DNA (cytosine-5)-methyltransferase 1